MNNILLITFFILAIHTAKAQSYIKSGSIEYEVKTNTYALNEGNEWFDRFKDQIPKFSTNYYTLLFSDNKSIYKFDRKGDTKTAFWAANEDENIWFNDYNTHSYATLMILDGYILLNGEQKKIEWKLFPNEQREIAGFNCRKAQAVLFDSVYVFAYYADEIVISGGPMNLNGLPGAILGVTVPRLHTSWMATGLKTEKPDASILVAPSKGKTQAREEIAIKLNEMAKSMGGVNRRWLDQLYWRTFM